ncbi:MAG: transporter substrate-binding domain-containing protein [bacterium]|nr:transporter substrate-binding domain-containing protein [bacterium]
MGKKIRFLNKTIFGVILFLFAVSQFTLVSYGATKIEQIKSAGKLVVGTSADYPPYEFHLLNDKDGDLVGIDIDIAKVIAAELGVKLEVKDIIFSKIFTALESGQIDLGIAGLSPTEERKKKANFSNIYYQAIQTVVTTTANADKIKAIEDLRGMKVGVQKDSIQADMAKTNIPGAEFTVRETIEELVIILKKGLVDACILEKPVADSYVSRNKEFVTINCKSLDNVLGSAIAVKKGDADLLKEINRILKKLKDEKKIAEFVENAKMLTNKR